MQNRRNVDYTSKIINTHCRLAPAPAPAPAVDNYCAIHRQRQRTLSNGVRKWHKHEWFSLIMSWLGKWVEAAKLRIPPPNKINTPSQLAHYTWIITWLPGVVLLWSFGDHPLKEAFLRPSLWTAELELPLFASLMTQAVLSLSDSRCWYDWMSWTNVSFKQFRLKLKSIIAWLRK